jgi:serine/threonine protein phosphatase PrpC
MTQRLKIALGQHSDAGRKPANQDFHGALVAEGAALAVKGVAVALADGIGSSAVGAVAAETAVKSFLTDYYATADSWSVRTSAERVIAATNSWLHAQNRSGAGFEDRDRGYVCTFDALVLKSRTAHIFHIGDARIYRLQGAGIEPLTDDHRVSMSSHETYLARALGANRHVEIDYRKVAVQPGDLFLLATDGVHEHVPPAVLARLLRDGSDDLDAAARAIVDAALAAGSEDNLTAQVVRVDALPEGRLEDLLDDPHGLPPAPLLEPRSLFEGYRILREIYASNRSHIYLAVDEETGSRVAIKVPSVEARDDSQALRRMMMEEWIARRVNHPNVVKAPPRSRRRDHLYVVCEHVEGQSLDQWMRDHPQPSLELVRSIVEQVASGLQALHRKEMLHQDIRPNNIMIDADGVVRIVDLGSVWVSGAAETGQSATQASDILGTEQYSAPECLMGEGGSPRSDLFSLGVITYQMLTGQLPFGTRAARVRNAAQLRALSYRPAGELNPEVPSWVDAAIAKATQPFAMRRYEELSEFTCDLRHPNPSLAQSSERAIAQRRPVLFWQLVSLGLAIAVVLLLTRI